MLYNIVYVVLCSPSPEPQLALLWFIKIVAAAVQLWRSVCSSSSFAASMLSGKVCDCLL